MNYSNLRSQILAAIKYPPKISAASLQEQLINIVNGLDLGALLLGVATPSLTPNTEANGFYFALQSGTYTNFPTINGQTITIDSSEVAIIVRSGNYWSKIHITTYPTIDPTTKHWMIGNEDTGVLAEGTTPHIDQESGNWMIGTYDTGIHAQGAPGKDAYQPFKGTFSSVQDLNAAYPEPNDGDTAYVEDTVENTTVLKVYDVVNGEWHDTGTTADSPVFGSGQLLSSVKIDDTHLANPADGSLPKAEDVMQLKAKLEGVTASEVKADYNKKEGYKVQGDGSISSGYNDNYSWMEIPLGDAKSIRFLGNLYGTSSTSTTKNTGFAFLHYEDNSEVIDYASHFDASEDNSNTETKEYEFVIKDIAPNATHFKTTCKGSRINDNNFYCYLRTGENVEDRFAQTDDKIDDINTSLYGSEETGALTKTFNFNVSQGVSHNSPKLELGNTIEAGVLAQFQCNGLGTFLSIFVIKCYDKSGNQMQPNGYKEKYIALTTGSPTKRARFTKDVAYISYQYSSSQAIGTGEASLTVTYNGIIVNNRVVAYLSDIESIDANIGIELHPFEIKKSISSTSGNWIEYIDKNEAMHYMIPVNEGDKIVVTRGYSSIFRYAFLLNGDTNGKASFVEDTTIYSLSIDKAELTIPAGTKFLYLQANTSNNIVPAPSSIILQANITAMRDIDERINKCDKLDCNAWPPTVDSDGKDVVDTLQVLNALKKGDQLRLVGFTPKNDIPAKTTCLTGGKQRISVPYSSNNDDLKLVGLQVSLHTFMTAINNPYSLMYTERCNSVNSKSAWDKVYDSTNAWSYYGTVCCGLTSSVYGIDYKVHNGVIGRPYRDFGDYIQLAPEGQVDFNNIKVGDIGNRYKDVHSFMIYGIERDSNYAITHVTIIESSSAFTAEESGNGTGGIRTHRFDSAGFEHYVRTGKKDNGQTGDSPSTLYRYRNAYLNTNYEPSVFVAVEENEEVEPFVYNNEICTFAGDRATFMAGELVVVNYNLDGEHVPNEIKVYKDNALYGTFSVEDANNSYESTWRAKRLDGYNVIDQLDHALVLGTELPPGKYKACLDDSENYTYWEVLDSFVVIRKVDDDSYKLIFKEEPSVVYFPAFTEHGALQTYTLQVANREDKALKQMMIHPKTQYILSRYYTYPYDGKIRVSFKGDYGIATTRVIALEAGEI